MTKISINPLTNKKYEIPDNLSHKLFVDEFIEQNKDKKVVVVQGLGFVGAVMSIVVANALTEEYAVIGIDLPTENTYWKICAINEGVFPVVADDPKIDLYYQNSRKKENFIATYDPYVYSLADIVIVDINLDVKKISNNKNQLESFDVNLAPFKKAIESIGNYCKQNVLILIETTVPPGTSQKIVKPIIEECLIKRGLKTDEYKIAHSYERVMPGPKYIDSIQNFYRVFSGINEESAKAAELFLKTVIKTDEYPLTQLGNTNATEMAKVLENSFRAMNIAFMVEWSRFAEDAGVDIYEVVNAIRMRPTHKNMMLPGLGVGGYCLTKDPLLASWAKQNLFDSVEPLSQSEKGVFINDQMPLFAFAFLQKEFKQNLKEKTVLLLGVSYLNDVGDTRFTPVEGIFNELIKNKCVVSLHDPHILYWEEKKIFPEQNLEKALQKDHEIIIITTGHKEYRNNSNLIDLLMAKSSVFIYDTIGVLNKEEIIKLKTKHTVKVIGRGDL